ncbi:protein MULTIPLE CHLOROPLAST DIVISION SITE 1 [Manihot esculenta]|uniref:Protein MULTIPLE CHLOROPLAST DIVISION SITE 1 n=1 Tax=Manihot esculenta TaxID=3983 RepID=A0A2C9VVQ6_MANES|nr:protein MULTIPLE CHLOROPLAST DIVISION SITE 1 [Manihot esculenta]OAY50312.1 hypothetical protein MANES_05G126100v8 [Manihot esculenta]
MASLWTLQSYPFSIQPSIWVSKRRVYPKFLQLRREFDHPHSHLKWNRPTVNTCFQLRAISSTGSSEDEELPQHEVVKIHSESRHPIAQLQGMISTSPPVVFLTRRRAGSNFMIWLCVATAFLLIAVRVYVVRKSRYNRPGSVADLVRRGQLRSDRRGISRPLKYDDPFNNPLVKVGKSNSTIEMCGKVYKLAPVTLTEEQQAIHQKRRSRAYQWKRPTIFLKEGDSVPPDVDPDTVRWIPANHPFATTASDIDEGLAQNNVYQKHGVPFRIQAEHEALQRKLEALQHEQKLNKLVIDTSNAKDFERPLKFNSKSNELIEQSPFSNQAGDPKPSVSDSAPNSFKSNSSSEEM